MAAPKTHQSPTIQRLKNLAGVLTIAALTAFIVTKFLQPKDNSIKALTTFKELKVKTVAQVDDAWLVIGECLTEKKAVLMLGTQGFDILEYASTGASGYCSKGTMVKASTELKKNSFLTIEPELFFK